MKLLLDTHALLWWLNDDDRLGPKAKALIADPDNEILISIVSFSEMAVKIRVGSLQVDLAAVWRAILRDGFVPLEIADVHLLKLLELPVHHRDPFDHLLIAQAIVGGADILSDDTAIARYKVGRVRCAA